MHYPTKLIIGHLIKRYKRFLADVELEDGTIVTAHCPNSGSMESVKTPGAKVWLSPAKNKNRKLKFTWELIQVRDTLVGINTNLSNKIVVEGIENGLIPELDGYTILTQEVPYGQNSRIDILLRSPDKPDCYVEVKNTTLRRQWNKEGLVEFPDAVTKRGTKHLRELAEMVKHGNRSIMFFLVQREDANRFCIAEDIDPEYGATFKEAIKCGVEVLCYTCSLTTERIKINSAIDVMLTKK
ncbi:MAG: Sugar fermentation stimulation protein A [Alphaproteobacteria bacterium MarineAlpha3_Bin5]|nr:DNA/RNA nuclease SfsA [Magnetovibrio sp.]PPR75458.1 MAG: Sugar fermentation stimulation protein A [Alphaproteobacteria bacterium MarineAlpha3_Bin5]|tara:strand:+ start:909 stop:1628 length:720 start_codon:yes stop_codon:yes gene_type:complete